jgi:hypothetical protein
MSENEKAPTRDSIAVTGAGNVTRLGTADGPKISPEPRRTQAQIRPTDPIILASQCWMVSDLLAEAVEHAGVCGLSVLAAAREHDDAAIIATFAAFDAAARAAKACACELRDLVERRAQ